MSNFIRALVTRDWGKLALALLVVAGLLGWDSYTTYRAVTDASSQPLERLSLVIDRNLTGQLDATLRVLQRVRSNVEQSGKTGDWATMSGDLAAFELALPGVRTLLVIDAKGKVLAANRPELLGLDLSQRTYFQLARDRLDSKTVHLSPPFRTLLGAWGMNLVLRSEGPAGKFSGIVLATLDQEYFATLMDSVRYQPDVAAALAHGTGVLYAYFPQRLALDGENLAVPGSFFSRHQESGQVATLMSGVVHVTGEARMMAQRTIRPTAMLSDHALVVGVSRDLAVIYMPWKRHAVMLALVFVFVSGAAVLANLAIQRRRRRDAQKVASAMDSVRINDKYFRAVVQDQTEMIFRFKADGTITFANDVFFRFFNVAEDQLYNLRWQPMVHPDDLSLMQARLRQLGPENPVVMIENRVYSGGGKLHWMQFVNRGFFDGTGRMSEIQSVGRDITERKNTEIALLEMHHELEHRIEQLSRLAIEVTLAEERERQSAAHDLHDGIGQILHVAKLKIDALAKRVPKSAMGAIGELNTLVADASRQLRSLTAQLSPPVLKDLGLMPALHWLAEEIDRIYGLPVEVVEECAPSHVSAAESAILFRTVRELLINVAKHAQSAAALVHVRCTADQLFITVSDTGVGIADLPAAMAARNHEGGIGLSSVQERISALGGSMEIRTSPDQGTTVKLKMLLKQDDGNSNERIAQ